MLELLQRVLDLLPGDLIVIDRSSVPLFFVGDPHGDPTAVDHARFFLEKTDGKAIFLGDYGDRGLHQRETIASLLSLFLENPERIVLLRGNHEPGPASHPLHTGRPVPYDIVRFLDPDELSLYEEIHVKLPILYFNVVARIVAVHGFLSASMIKNLPNVKLEKEDVVLALWSDTDPLSTEFRGIPVPDPWDWRRDRVEKVLEERDLFLLKGHSPHELNLPSERIRVLFAHCKDTGGYYDYGVRYALFNGELRFLEVIPCGSHKEILQSLRKILL